MPFHNMFLLSNFCTTSGKFQQRPTRGIRQNLNIRPGNPPCPSGPQRLEHRLLGRESPRHMFDVSLGIFRTQYACSPGVKTRDKKMIPMPIQQIAHAAAFRRYQFRGRES